MLIRHSTPRARRHAKIRAVIKGTAQKPRLSIFRSNRQVVCQLIDDVAGKTLVAASGIHLDSAPRRFRLPVRAPRRQRKWRPTDR